jgi:threonine/homoserine/homoserine lactone efflux protein
MSSAAQFTAFLLASALVIVLPGPATLFVAGRAHASTRAAVAAVAGIVAGDVVLIALSGLGVAALVARWPNLLDAIRIIGALYVAWLGVGLLRAPAAPATAAQRAHTGDALRGLLLTLSNPKPILFFAAFFPLFLDPAAASAMQGYYRLGAWFELLNLAWFALLVLAVRRLRRSDALAALPRGLVHRLAGCGLLLCAALVWARGTG